MATPSKAALGETPVRDAIDVRRLPWIRPLVADYAERFSAVGSLFAGNPADPAAWRDTIARVTRAYASGPLVAGALASQLDERGAPPAARAAAAALGEPGTVAVVTGQQAGVFGGPLYTVLKAITAIQLARRVSAEHGTKAIAVFWVDAEDHDWDEVRSAAVLDADADVRTVAVSPIPGAGSRPVGTLALPDDITETLDVLAASLAQTEFTSAVVEALRAHYRPGLTLAGAFARWLEHLLGSEGLVVFDASDTRTKPEAAGIFVRELSGQGTAALVRQAGEAMRALGHAPQLEPGDDSVHLFYLDADGRRPIRRRGDDYTIGDTARSRSELAAEAQAHPERFSPNVVLRPIVQDRLFPTICYVAGPAELAYQAQLGGVYQAFGVERPLLYSRASATMIDSGCLRFLDRHPVPFESLQPQDDTLLNQLLTQQLPAAIDRILQESTQFFADRAGALREAVTEVDPTLAGTVDTTANKIGEALRTLQTKIVQASKRRDETLRRQFARARALAFPGGVPQERTLSLAFFANRYGLDFAARLLAVVPLDTSRHYLITL